MIGEPPEWAWSAIAGEPRAARASGISARFD
jgi:hypothetical protein